MPLQAKIKRVDTTLPLPRYATAGAVGFDMVSRETVIISPKTLVRIPSNLIIEIPAGYALLVVPRSSTPKKKGLLIPHGMGVIDRDYCGPADEILIQLYNFTAEEVTVERGERIAQGLFTRIDRVEWKEVETMAHNDTRGGFGSTEPQSKMNMNKQDILDIIARDSWMMEVLRAARLLHLPDWMIGGGFVRNKIWDVLHGFQNDMVPTADIDLIYFDPRITDAWQEKTYDTQLKKILDLNWSSKNQARMHLKHNRSPYKNIEEALSDWVETATAVAVRLQDDSTLRLFAPHGIDDLMHLIVRPTPLHASSLQHFHERVHGKKWRERWPKLKVVEI
ncbi:MAG: dUTP diphosphatase [Parcubacteria group bacterium CG_4_10_14_0_8_um_filter_48_154]|nr:MAG: dUTP diphosphatase [Parcubacteria group bacterium CG_4_10_14_0_8_um_filter_48_154]